LSIKFNIYKPNLPFQQKLEWRPGSKREEP
jgi:hypothetical protein